MAVRPPCPPPSPFRLRVYTHAIRTERELASYDVWLRYDQTQLVSFPNAARFSPRLRSIAYVKPGLRVLLDPWPYRCEGLLAGQQRDVGRSTAFYYPPSTVGRVWLLRTITFSRNLAGNVTLQGQSCSRTDKPGFIFFVRQPERACQVPLGK